MKPFGYLLIVVAIVAAILLAMRYVRHERARRVALPVIAELGGRVGSITAPFGGTEYAISFRGRALTRSEIDRLVVLGELTRTGGYVSVTLDELISDADRAYLKRLLPDVHWHFELPDSDDHAPVVTDASVIDGSDHPVVGFWQVRAATADGEPWVEAAGQVHHFMAGGKVRTVGHDFEANQQYRCNATRDPKELVAYYSDVAKAGAGIFQLEGDALRWRVADEPQSLSFSAAPRGHWNEYEFTRLTAAEAKIAIQKLQDERMHNEASAP